MLVVAMADERISHHVGDATGHAGTQVHSGRTQNDHDARCHVFTSVLAYALDHGERTAVAHGKSFTGTTGDVELSGSRAVEDGIAHQDVATKRRVIPGCDGD